MGDKRRQWVNGEVSLIQIYLDMYDIIIFILYVLYVNMYLTQNRSTLSDSCPSSCGPNDVYVGPQSLSGLPPLSCSDSIERHLSHLQIPQPTVNTVRIAGPTQGLDVPGQLGGLHEAHLPGDSPRSV